MSDEKTNQESVQKPEVSVIPPVSEQHINVSYTRNVEDILSQLININESGVMHEPACQICSCPDKTEIEQKYEETQSPKDTKKFMAEKGIHFSVDIIENHMRCHYLKGVRELQKLEYVNRLKRISGMDVTTLDRIDSGLAALTERLVGINSITPNKDTGATEIEEIKSTETAKLMNAYNQMLKLRASIIGEMKNSGDIINIPRQAFIEIFSQSILNAKTDGEKEAIKNILNKLTQLGNIVQ